MARVKLEVWKAGKKVVDMDEKNIDTGGVGSLFRSLFMKLLRDKDEISGTITEYVPDKNELIQMDEIKEARE